MTPEQMARQITKMLNRMAPDSPGEWRKTVSEMPAAALPAVWMILMEPEFTDIYELVIEAVRKGRLTVRA